MAKDRKGNELKVGSNVWIPATVKSINTINGDDRNIISVVPALGVADKSILATDSIALQGAQVYEDKKPPNFPDR